MSDMRDRPTDQPPIDPFTLLYERDQQKRKEREALRPYVWLYSILGVAMVVLVEVGLDGFWPLRLMFLPLIGYFVMMGIGEAEDRIRGM